MKADVSLGIFLGDDVKLFARHVRLLKAVQDTGSITQAAQKIGISYKTAWDTLDMLNNKSQKPLLQRADGAKKNSGSCLSEYAKTLISNFEELLAIQQSFLERVLACGLDAKDLAELNSLSLALSARNQLAAKVSELSYDEIDAKVIASLSGEQKLCVWLSTSSLKALNLNQDSNVILVFKSCAVELLSAKAEQKAQNVLKTELLSINLSKEYAELFLSLSQSQSLTARISATRAKELKIGQTCWVKIDPANIIIGV